MTPSKTPTPAPPTPPVEQPVRGTISHVHGSEVFATLDAPYGTEHGPMNYVTKPSVGERCLVAFDVNQSGYIIWHA